MTRTYKGKEVSLEELFQLFHRFCKDNNIRYHTATQYNILGELLVFDLLKPSKKTHVLQPWEYVKMERFNSFLTEMNLKKSIY